tara:strand:- start:295 stop:624 length:330 start_codon:yes stop_codon:yes gene_type:complete
MQNFTFHDVVGALRPMIERANFIEEPHPNRGHKKRPIYDNTNDSTRFIRGEQSVEFVCASGQIGIILHEAGEDPDPIDADCPKRSAPKDGSVYNSSTLRCLKRKLNRWL